MTPPGNSKVLLTSSSSSKKIKLIRGNYKEGSD